MTATLGDQLQNVRGEYMDIAEKAQIDKWYNLHIQSIRKL